MNWVEHVDHIVGSFIAMLLAHAVTYGTVKQQFKAVWNSIWTLQDKLLMPRSNAPKIPFLAKEEVTNSGVE